MTPAYLHEHDERRQHGANLRRIMARLNLTLADVVAATGVDERTLRSLLRGHGRPQARTLHKLAAGLGVDVDQLFDAAAPAAFDRAANPAVARLIRTQEQLFAEWSPADFDELFSRVGVGGELTEEGARAAAETMNRRRELLQQVAVILESSEAELMRQMIAALYERATTLPR